MKIKRLIEFSFVNILVVFIVLIFDNAKFQGFTTSHYHWTDISNNPSSQDYTKVLAEETWGQAGTLAYPAAAKWMKTNNGSSRPLDDIQKKYLRSYFGDLVDRVAIVYDSKLMDSWLHAYFKIDIGQVDAIAQTYCQRIYIEDSYKPGDLVQLVLLAHELVHSRQCELLGGTTQFGYAYFKEFKRASQSYKDNKLEREAKDTQLQVNKWLSHQTADNKIETKSGVVK